MKQLAGQHVLILGLGASGLAMARWCVRHGAQVAVWDSRGTPPQAGALQAELPGVALRSGALGAADVQGLHWLLKSPGLAPQDARIAPVLQAAQAAGVRVGGELDLFVLALSDLKTGTGVRTEIEGEIEGEGDAGRERTPGYSPQVLAITGTNGKTTTTALTALLVERAGRSTVAAGNIGPSLLDTLAARIDSGELPQVWVLELSSFQLGDMAPGCAFEPTAATVLNISQDHLDWHGTMDDYAAAKQRIFGGPGAAGTRVINRDDARVRALEPAPPIAKLPKGAARPALRNNIRFGLDAPQHPGDFGLVVENGMAWLVRAMPIDDSIKRRKSDDAPEIHLQRLMPADALRLRGRHNASNALAALALATAIGCPLAPMLHGLREYRGEPHRVEPVGQIGHVEAFDDSKGTNVGATVAALQGLGAERAPAKLVLILGGDGKGQDFGPLAAPVAAFVRAVALIGRDAPLLEVALRETGVPCLSHSSLEAATRWCFEQAQAGDAVLLSPACASLDMFRNYAHRAEVFVATVRQLAADAGEMAS